VKINRKLFRELYYNTFNLLKVSDSLIRNKAKSQKIILTYHNVLPENQLTSYFTNFVDVSVDTFEKHIQFLIKNYQINDASLLRDPKAKGFFLSFDDAMFNNVKIVEPILRKHNITAMFAACSGLISGDIRYLWRDEIFLFLNQNLGKEVSILLKDKIEKRVVLSDNVNSIAQIITQHIQKAGLMDNVYEYIDNLKKINGFKILNAEPLRYNSASLQDLIRLKKAGHLIASHTISHKKLSYLNLTQLEDELRTSREYFELNIGSTDCLVYPYGTSMEVNKECFKLAKKVGYKYAFMNTPSAKESDFSIPRLNMTNITSESVFKGVLAMINKL
jgi:peptidoglycan/xylan/chitin deacetylase (PgdA/CDA1 family)